MYGRVREGARGSVRLEGPARGLSRSPVRAEVGIKEDKKEVRPTVPDSKDSLALVNAGDMAYLRSVSNLTVMSSGATIEVPLVPLLVVVAVCRDVRRRSCSACGGRLAVYSTQSGSAMYDSSALVGARCENVARRRLQK